MGRDYRHFVLIKWLFLVSVAANVFVSDLGYVLGDECVLDVVSRWLVGQGC